MSFKNEMISTEEAARELEASALFNHDLGASDPYLRALEWANARGESFGAQEMRKLILSLYNTSAFHHSVGEVLRSLDVSGACLVFDALDHFWRRGETAALQRAGSEIKASGLLDAWIAASVNRSPNQ